MTTRCCFALAAALAACGSKPPAEKPIDKTAEPVDRPAPPDAAITDEPARGEPALPDPKASLLAAETSAWEAARPVFVKYCAVCHTKDGKKALKKKLDHFTMDSYPLGGHHTATIGFTIREVLGLAGKKATMPYDKPGSVKGDELVTIRTWIDAWEAADKAGAHGTAAGPDHDDDDDDHDHDDH